MIDSIELLLLRSHLVGHFVELLDLGLLWTDVLLELLDLVVQHKLKLLQLQNLLILFFQPKHFLGYGLFSLLLLSFVSLDLLLVLDLHLHQSFKLMVLLFNLSEFVGSHILLLLEPCLLFSQIGCQLHTCLDLIQQECLVLVLELVYVLPCRLLCIGSLLWNLHLQCLLLGLKIEHLLLKVQPLSLMLAIDQLYLFLLTDLHLHELLFPILDHFFLLL